MKNKNIEIKTSKMSCNNDFQNMDWYPTLIPIYRTHKATCPYCYGCSETRDPNNRVVACYWCEKTIPLQKFARGFLIRKKIKHMKKKELMQRWFITKDVNGIELSNIISKFL